MLVEYANTISFFPFLIVRNALPVLNLFFSFLIFKLKRRSLPKVRVARSQGTDLPLAQGKLQCEAYKRGTVFGGFFRGTDWSFID